MVRGEILRVMGMGGGIFVNCFIWFFVDMIWGWGYHVFWRLIDLRRMDCIKRSCGLMTGGAGIVEQRAFCSWGVASFETAGSAAWVWDVARVVLCKGCDFPDVVSNHVGCNAF